MRLVSIRQEAHYRGYRIEGAKQGQGMLSVYLRRDPTLRVLRYAHFRTLRSMWIKAVGVVVGYIDEGFLETAHVPKARGGGFARVRTYEPTDEAQLDEILRAAPTRTAGEERVFRPCSGPKQRTIERH